MAIKLAHAPALSMFSIVAHFLLFRWHEHQRKRTELAPVGGVEERHEDLDGIAAEGFCRFAGIVVYMCSRQREFRPAGGHLHSAQVLEAAQKEIGK